MKRFPVAEAHKSHEDMLAILVLMLLPLLMKYKVGFFAILWAPWMSFSIITLQDVAAQLDDPICLSPR